jgi:hypothetical protein
MLPPQCRPRSEHIHGTLISLLGPGADVLLQSVQVEGAMQGNAQASEKSRQQSFLASSVLDIMGLGNTDHTNTEHAFPDLVVRARLAECLTFPESK